MMEGIDEYLEDMHFTLSMYAACPVIGIIPAGLKVSAGLVESVASTAFSLLLLMPSLYSKRARASLTWSFSHISSGLIRASFGVSLGLPCVGTAIVIHTLGIQISSLLSRFSYYRSCPRSLLENNTIRLVLA